MSVLLALTSLIVDGVVVEQHSAWEGGMIVTRSTVATDDGDVVVRHFGGEVDGIGQMVLGSDPWIAVGERVQLEVEPRGGELALEAKAALPDSQFYVRTTTLSSNPPCSGGGAYPLYWGVVTVPYVLDAAGTPDVGFAQVQSAVRTSFATWQVIDCSYIAFDDEGTVSGFPIGYDEGGDNRNLITWLESNWSHASTAIAVTVLTFSCGDGEIFDADILMNGQTFTFTATPPAGEAHDIQNTVTHEIGHLIGFDHTPDGLSTMYADAEAGETSKRDLTDDDIEGVCDVYTVGEEPEAPGCCQGGPATGAVLGPLVGLWLLISSSRRSRPAANRRSRSTAEPAPHTIP